jgi:hypothetical protein
MHSARFWLGIHLKTPEEQEQHSEDNKATMVKCVRNCISTATVAVRVIFNLNCLEFDGPGRAGAGGGSSQRVTAGYCRFTGIAQVSRTRTKPASH